jgi:hypothetical protein
MASIPIKSNSNKQLYKLTINVLQIGGMDKNDDADILEDKTSAPIAIDAVVENSDDMMAPPILEDDTGVPPVIGDVSIDAEPQYMEPSHLTLHVIKAGTVLYHGSMLKDTFNPLEIRLGKDTLVAFFSQNKRFAQDYIKGCATYPNEKGYVHKFVVKKDIDKILIISQYDRFNDWDPSVIENKYCGSSREYNGVGFFVSTDDQRIFGSAIDGDSVFAAEFALCKPQDFLEYVSTESCISARKMSNEYNFAK